MFASWDDVDKVKKENAIGPNLIFISIHACDSGGECKIIGESNQEYGWKDQRPQRF